MIYYLIRGNQVIAAIDSTGSVVALPLLGGGDAMSLMSQLHVQALMDSQGWTAAQALDALNLADLRSSALSAIALGRNPVSLDGIGIAAYHLLDVDRYSLWQCNAQQDDLLQLHAVMWVIAPTETLGLLAVVRTPGSEFYPAAMRTATGMSVEQALLRRDRIATYLEGLGYGDTGGIRASTNEHEQMIGIAIALGYTEQQLWSAMV